VRGYQLRHLGLSGSGRSAVTFSKDRIYFFGVAVDFGAAVFALVTFAAAFAGELVFVAELAA
jgi:hypothetical protein